MKSLPPLSQGRKCLFSTMSKKYERPEGEIMMITGEENFLQSGGNGTSESVGYDEDPFEQGGK